jgi:hypothetical protein
VTVVEGEKKEGGVEGQYNGRRYGGLAVESHILDSGTHVHQ